MNVKYFVNKIVDSLILFRTACSIWSSDYMEVFFPKNVGKITCENSNGFKKNNILYKISHGWLSLLY